ncbi:right-handed parallel beta-helix repeat-containing protein [Falsiroseomonas sp. HW251]|uniref:right-handed parallel beta-helix repeat-containing protein n=1 Tax=Falsiroseomonas sp. HW251 TaxID=3390998 RepID=UPI003D31DBAB
MASTSVGLTGTTYSAPAGAVFIAAGTDIMSVVSKYPAGTAFLLGSGTFYGQTISPRNGDQFYGQQGTVLDGNGATKAFWGQGVSNVTIAGISFTDYAAPGSGIGILGTDGGSSGWKVLGNQFYGNADGPVLMLGGGMLVQDCYFHDNADNAIASWNVSGAIIQNCEFSNNHMSGESPFSATGSGAAVKLAQTTNVQFLNNYVHDTVAGPGIWTDINCSGTVIDGNTITRNAAGGIFIELDYGTVIRNNTITDNNKTLYEGFQGGGIYVYNAQNADIYNNVIANNGGGIWLYEGSRGTGSQGEWLTRNVSIHDNTVIATSGQHGVGGTATNDGSITFGNDDYNLSGTAKFVYGGTVTAAQWQALGYDTAGSGSIYNATWSGTTTGGGTTGGTTGSTAGGTTGGTTGSGTTGGTTGFTPAALAYGSGTDTLVLKISQDAWNGSAQYTVSVDGVQQGGTWTASALHGSGQSDTLTIKGNWAAGTHSVAVTFLNDDWGGSATTDRNLYVDAMSYGGTAVVGATATLLTNGAQSLAFTEAAAPTSVPVALNVGTGPDTLVLKISQDAWNGSAQYTVSVDGVQQGGTWTASALHGSGQSDTLTIKGNWAAGTHSVSVNFLNDDWGGTTTTDRNLYVDAVSYDGKAVVGGSLAFSSNGAKGIAFVEAAGASLAGTTAADKLTGTAGEDTIRGGAGGDIMTGGGDSDTFIIGPRAGFDRITDFESGSDHILFRNITATQVTTKAATYNGVTGTDVFYGNGTSHHVFLENVTKVAAGDFLFG